MEKKHTGTKSDTVGPGDYDVLKPLGQTKRGVPQWSPPKSGKKSALSSLANKTPIP